MIPEKAATSNIRIFPNPASQIDNTDYDEFIHAITFMKAAHAACTVPDKLYKYQCPLCGGEATAIKDGPSGHVGAECGHCRIGIQE